MFSRLRIAISEPGSDNFDVNLLVDDNRFGEGVCIDPAQLRDSALGSGSFSLLTCGCGIPECAGIFEPVFVAHRADTVIWECSDEFYPSVNESEPTQSRTLRYIFSRAQYVDAVRDMFQRLRFHPDARGTKSWYHDFDPSVFDESFPAAVEPQTPFPQGSTLLVGQIGRYRQPWVWVEEFEDVGPSYLLPTRRMSLRFGRWSSMFDSRMGTPRECLNPEAAQVEGAALARELESFWCTKIRLESVSRS